MKIPLYPPLQVSTLTEARYFVRWACDYLGETLTEDTDFSDYELTQVRAMECNHFLNCAKLLFADAKQDIYAYAAAQCL